MNSISNAKKKKDQLVIDSSVEISISNLMIIEKYSAFRNEMSKIYCAILFPIKEKKNKKKQ